jgi:hypothetical protein
MRRGMKKGDTDEVEFDLNAPQYPAPRFVVPTEVWVDLTQARKAVLEFAEALDKAFKTKLAASQVIERRSRLSDGLDAIYEFLKKLGIPALGEEFEELRSALLDVNRGIKHPLLIPKNPKKYDASQFWRGRANLALAIEAHAAQNKLTFLQAADEIFQKSTSYKILRQLAPKKIQGNLQSESVYDTQTEKDHLKKAVQRWAKNLSSRPENAEAGELYNVTKELILMAKKDKKAELLIQIERRCLYAASKNGALTNAQGTL